MIYEIYYVNVSAIADIDVPQFMDDFVKIFKTDEKNIKRIFVPTYKETHIEIIK